MTLQDKTRWDTVKNLNTRITMLESMIGYPINPS